MRLSSLAKRVSPRVRDPHTCDFHSLVARLDLFMRDRREPAADEPGDCGDAKAMRREQWSRHTIASCASKQADRTASLGTKARRRHRTNAPRVPKASLERRRRRFFSWIVHSGLAIFMRQTARDRRGFLCAMAAVLCRAPGGSRGTRQGWRFKRHAEAMPEAGGARNPSARGSPIAKSVPHLPRGPHHGWREAACGVRSLWSERNKYTLS
jgi:hypothetical protein